MALFHHNGVGAGVIDAYYRGNVGVLLFNHSDAPFIGNRGDKIAQLICKKIYYPKLELVEEKLNDTWRGARGFGSTGQS
jgi:dUTP pyrophosphatase